MKKPNPLELETQAKVMIEQTPNGHIILFGWPIGTPQQPDQTEIVDAFCDKCGNGCQSTKLKEMVRKITRNTKKPAVFFCQPCMESFIEDLGDPHL